MVNRFGINKYDNIFSRGFSGFEDMFSELSRETMLLDNLTVLKKETKDDKITYNILAYGLEKNDIEVLINTYNVYFDIIIKAKQYTDMTIRLSNDYNDKEIDIELNNGILTVSVKANKENTRRISIK